MAKPEVPRPVGAEPATELVVKDIVRVQVAKAPSAGEHSLTNAKKYRSRRSWSDRPIQFRASWTTGPSPVPRSRLGRR